MNFHGTLFMNPTPPQPNIKTSTRFSLPIPKIPGLPEIESGTHLISDTSIVRPREIVAGLLHQGTKAVLASGSKAGKTWVLLDLALSVATGTRFLRWGTARGKVLFINFEIHKAFIKERLTALMNRRGITNVEGLDIWNLRGKTADFEALVANIIRKVEGKNYALIVLDPIYKAMVGKSENGASGVGVLCNQLERLAERTGAAVVFSHHFTKGNAKKKAVIDRMSGSGVFARDADTILAFTEHVTPDCYTVETILRNMPAQESFVVQWSYPVMIERDDLDPEDIDMAGSETMNNDQGLLALNNGPLSNAEWQAQADGLGHSRATYYRIRRRLAQEGRVQFDRVINTWSLVVQVDDVPTVPPSSDAVGSLVAEPVPAPRIEPPLAPWERLSNRPAGAEQEDITGLWQGEPPPAR